MSRLAIFFLLPYIFSASGFIRSNDVSFDENNLDVSNIKSREKIVEDEEKRTLWVVRLKNEDINDLRLELATRTEEEDFDDVIQPLILTLLLLGRQNMLTNVNLTKQYPEVEQDQELKQEILRIVNKFVLSTHNEPDIYLPDESDSCLLAINFKGPYTSLVVSYGRKQWYFNILPSPFPRWFYEEHMEVMVTDGEEAYISVPENVKHDFYKALLFIVNKLLGFPL